MKPSNREALIRLGAGESIDSVCAACGLTRDTVQEWFNREASARLPETTGTKQAMLKGEVKIVRDAWGVPHIYGSTDEALFFGYGYAMAQDRLWQMDYYRRRASGRVSEILGASGMEMDTIARTVGFSRLSRLSLKKLAPQTRERLQWFSNGVNGAIEQAGEELPIEFALLDYRPEPWAPFDCVITWKEFQWYLTGRLPAIAIAELAKRALGDRPLYGAFLKGEADTETIVPPGTYERGQTPTDPVGEVSGDPYEGVGSNNWVIGGSRSSSGAPMVASDPHIAFGAVGCWYEAHLVGGAFNAVGAGYLGVPGIILGRNDHIAWGVTNNGCSQRDLYAEKTDASHRGHFLYDGKWEKAKTIVEEIKVKGGETVNMAVTNSRNGPIVDDLLPAPLRETGPVSLKWLGASLTDEISCLLSLNQSRTAVEARSALKGWIVPTLNFVFADRQGHIGYQCSGRLPVRDGWDRAYRRGWDPAHRWQRVIPFECMPAIFDPPRGWILSANNRTAPEDFPYPLGGTWSSGNRARRIRQMLEEREKFSRQDFARMQLDVLSLRAVECVPNIIRLLEHYPDPKIESAVESLRSWDCRIETDQVAASIFTVFFQKWCETIAAERFPEDAVPIMAGASGGIAVQLLTGDTHGWFVKRKREEALAGAVADATRLLEDRLGPDMSAWTWGKVHKLGLPHLLSSRGALGFLMDRGGQPVSGNDTTVCCAGFDSNFMAFLGANYRLSADLSEDPPGLWTVDSAGASGNPGSEHYCDQTETWLAGKHKYLPLDRARVEAGAKATLTIKGAG